MNKFESCSRTLLWLAPLMLGALLAGCGGGGSSGGGTATLVGAAVAPVVTAVSPVAGATSVPINAKIYTVAFTKPMNVATFTAASFTLACPAGTAITGTYTVASNVATLTIPALTPNLPINTVCTATVTTAVQDTTGLGLAANFAWTFTTGAAADTTPPTVSSTVPTAGATVVAPNAIVTATFSEPIDPTTLAAAFTLACPAGTAIPGTVGYTAAGNVASFTPAANLPAPGIVCTATISTAPKDVAANAMAAAFVWTFTTGATLDTTAPTVTSTNPLNAAVGVCTNKTINTTFSEPMNPLTINTATVTLTTPAGALVTGTVGYNAASRIATFTPAASLTGTPATTYTVTIKGGLSGVKDLAGNALAIDKVSTFTTNATTCATLPALGAAAPFGGFGGTATLTNDGLTTVINGDIGVKAASTKITGLTDSGANVYTVTPNNNGKVNGLVYTLTAPPGSVAAAVVNQASTDALAAFNAVSPAVLTGGVDVSSLAQCPSCGGAGGGADDLGGRTLPPGVYASTTGTYALGAVARTVANLTLDAGGDANAVWVFQTAALTGTLTMGLIGPATPATPIQVLLVNGAQAKNVYWYVPGGATIGTGSTMVGTMLANASITISTTGGTPPTAVVTTLNGRAIALTAAVTMTNTVINIP